jgi:hypothetical protein
MHIEKRLKNIAKNYNLKFNFELRYLEMEIREIIIKNFIGDCPDPVYEKYRKKNNGNLTKSLVDYLSSKDYEDESKIPQACVAIKKELGIELKKIDEIGDINLKQETKDIYSKIQEGIKNKERLTLVWKNRDKNWDNQRNEIILHEFVHELLEHNGIRPKDWKWNEGLVTYITKNELNKLYEIKKVSNWRYSGMWNIYVEYANKWKKTLERIDNPEQRKNLILNKIKSLE